MTRSRTSNILRAILVLAVGAALVGPSSGCYRKVVGAKGIGADSSKLRSEYESRPLDFITTETRTDDREVRSARERERP